MRKIKIPSEKGCGWLRSNRNELLEEINRNEQKKQELSALGYDIRSKGKMANINKWIKNENKGYTNMLEEVKKK